MREKYESLALAQLKELAKIRGIKNSGTMKKAEIVEAMLVEDEKDKVKSEPTRVVTRPAESTRYNDEADQETMRELDSGVEASGFLEVLSDGYGFIRSDNFMPGADDVYVAPAQIRRFSLRTGDIVTGNKKVNTGMEKYSALLYVKSVNGLPPEQAAKRRAFEDMTPIFADERINLSYPGCNTSMRVMDLVSPVGKGQRGLIVSPPKAGKTTLLKEVATSILKGNPKTHMIILLIDERPEEVTDIKEAIRGENVEVVYSTFDELPEHHKREIGRAHV